MKTPPLILELPKVLSRAVFMLLFSATALAAPETIRLGYVNITDQQLESSTLLPTLGYLEERLPEYKFELVQVSPVDFLADVGRLNPNFLIVPSSYYFLVTDSINTTHIATRTTIRAEKPARSVGSAFIVRKDRAELQKIADLKGRKCVSSLPESLDGWLAAMGELDRREYSPDDFFSSVTFTQFQTPDVINEVLSGAADVGVLATCVLERHVEDGFIAPDALRVVEPQPFKTEGEGELRCLRSTKALYPDVEILALTMTNEEAVRRVAVALLSMPSFNEFRWSVETDRLAVNNLLKTLKTGPYAYLRDNSLPGIYRRHSREILLALAALLVLILYEVRLKFVIKRITRELGETQKEKDRLAEIARTERERLHLMERNGVISQLSSIIAHEAKQPIGAIINYLEVLRIHLNGMLKKDRLAREVIEEMDAQTQRLNSLVNYVRGYAQKKNEPLARTDLVAVVAKAVRHCVNYENAGASRENVAFSSRVDSAPVNGDRLSLELLFVNLVRNALQAALSGKGAAAGGVVVGVEVRQDRDKRVVVEIWNTGEELSDKEFSRLTSLNESIKPEGLGLGLPIVREIADRHGADLVFKRRPGGGLSVFLTMDLDDCD